MASKAERELTYARYLQSRLTELAGYSLECRHPPEPDIAATRANSVVAIEITEIHSNPLLRMTEAEQERTLRSAERIWRERSLPSVGVAVQWRPTRMPEKCPRDFPALLVDLVASHLPRAGNTIEINQHEAGRVLGSHSPVEHVFVRLSSTDVSEWGSGRHWTASWPAPDFYQRAIDRKNPKPCGYLARYDQRWLLLVHHGANPSSGFEVSENIEHVVFRSTFDQVFLMSLTPLTVRRLTIEQPVNRPSNDRSRQTPGDPQSAS